MSLLVASGLLAHAAACRTQPALARFGAFAAEPRLDGDGLAMLVCSLVAGLGAQPIGALAARGVGLDTGSDYWLVADPVCFVLGRSDVTLAGRVSDLTPEETEELLLALNAHFHEDGLAFVAPRPDLWLAHIPESFGLVTHSPERAQAMPLTRALPDGDAGPMWRRWQDEMQMLLHGHPVNLARESEGRAPANAVWVWGGGRLADAGPASPILVDAPATLVGDVLRGLASIPRTLDPGGEPRVVRVVPRLEQDGEVARFVADVLAPHLAALEQGRLRELTLVADGSGIAAAWTARAPSRWQRLSAGWRARPLRVPDPSQAAASTPTAASAPAMPA